MQTIAFMLLWVKSAFSVQNYFIILALGIVTFIVPFAETPLMSTFQNSVLKGIICKIMIGSKGQGGLDIAQLLHQ